MGFRTCPRVGTHRRAAGSATAQSHLGDRGDKTWCPSQAVEFRRCLVTSWGQFDPGRARDATEPRPGRLSDARASVDHALRVGSVVGTSVSVASHELAPPLDRNHLDHAVGLVPGVLESEQLLDPVSVISRRAMSRESCPSFRRIRRSRVSARYADTSTLAGSNLARLTRLLVRLADRGQVVRVFL